MKLKSTKIGLTIWVANKHLKSTFDLEKKEIKVNKSILGGQNWLEIDRKA